MSQKSYNMYLLTWKMYATEGMDLEISNVPIFYLITEIDEGIIVVLRI